MAIEKKVENSKKARKKPKSPDNNLKIQNLKINKKKPKSPDNNLKIRKLKTKSNKNNDKKKKKSNIIVDKEATIGEIVKKEKRKREENVNKNKKESKNNNNKKKEEKEEGYKFPQRRIRRIIKSNDSSIHISEDSIFLINKASEKFLELFCKEAYACATKEKKKHVEYKHLSSVVSKQKRFDFLSDFVPEKVKAGVALAETSSRERKLDS